MNRIYLAKDLSWERDKENEAIIIAKDIEDAKGFLNDEGKSNFYFTEIGVASPDVEPGIVIHDIRDPVDDVS